MSEISEKTAAKTKDGLNLKQEEFCQLYVNGDKELFGNGTQCYLQVYGLTDKKTGKTISYLAAMANASRLLRNDKVLKRINELLEVGGFNDENIDKQHLFLINQHADLKTKMAAIKEYNALKSRVQNKLDITSKGEKISNENKELVDKALNYFLDENNKRNNS